MISTKCKFPRLSNENNRWAFVSRTKQFFWRRCCAVTSLGNSIFVAGGEDAWNKPCSLVERFDKSTRKWTKLPNMNRKRCYFILTIIDGQMYAIDRKITTAERYDFQRRLWVNVSYRTAVSEKLSYFKNPSFDAFR